MEIKAQGMLVEVSLERQVDKSSLVVEGRVVEKKSVWNAQKNRIITINTVEVLKRFKGKSDLRINVLTPGGTVGYITQRVTPSLTLKKGDIGVFALYNSDMDLVTGSASTIKQYKPYSSLQGFYKYDLLNSTAANPFSKKKNIEAGLYEQITRITGEPYKDMLFFRLSEVAGETGRSKNALAPVISGLSPLELSAGTGEQLTISGSGFGSSGTVEFKNADDGGETFVAALDSQIVSWSDSQIVVEVPSGAGTGSVKVTDNSGVSVESANNLVVVYALSNRIMENGQALQIQHIGLGGNRIEWNMNEGFEANTQAKEAFMRAFDTWRCNTGINWQMGAETSINKGVIDGVNAVLFDDNDPLDDGVLGECRIVTNGCEGGVRAVVVELDVVFNSDINSSQTVADESWYFGEGAPAYDQYDFESVALHELGHGHLLAHVIDSGDVMHYAISNSETQRSLNAHNETAAGIIQNFNTTTQVCGQIVMGSYSGQGCNLGIQDLDLANALLVYPNPVNSLLYIENGSSVSLTKVVLYDLSGRVVLQRDLSPSSEGVNTINVQQVSKGLYMLNLFLENTVVNKKVIVE